MGLGASAGSFSTTLSQTSLALYHTLFPKIDLTTAGGVLQLAFVELGLIVVGFAVATLVSGWSSDESSGRLELVLAAPLARARWTIAAGLGLMAGIAVMTAVIALGIGIGAAGSGSEWTTPVLGTAVLGLYAMGLAGRGSGRRRPAAALGGRR